MCSEKQRGESTLKVKGCQCQKHDLEYILSFHLLGTDVFTQNEGVQGKAFNYLIKNILTQNIK